jgi:phytanoyl-CoA hydroxylase
VLSAVIQKTQKTFYDENGYLVLKGLFKDNEVALYRDHFMELRTQGSYPGDLAGVDLTSVDPLKRYPRMIHMHRWDELSMCWLLDERIKAVLLNLLGSEPYAVQTMLYFKPPRARGQALHQDNFFLQAHPGTCMAAWLALDSCDEANGCMQVVPGSHRWPLLCTTGADTKQSFTDITVPLPPGTEIRPIMMEPGDVLFFGGSLIHGSFPNTTEDRFRRALIGHYVSGEATQIAWYMQPVLRMDGTEVDFSYVNEGGPCGVWVDVDGRPVIELSGIEHKFPNRGE